MKTFTMGKSVLLILLLFIVNNGFCQPELINDVLSQNRTGSISSFFGGNIKPERTDLSGGFPSPPESRFPILIVFVQFANETEQDPVWQIGQAPAYMNDLLSYRIKANANWWEAYDTQTESMSSYWMEVSRGKFNVVGKCVNIVLDYDTSYYKHNGWEDRVNKDVYDKLKADTTIRWPDFDLWSMGNDGKFYFQKDGFVDMIYMVHRRTWAGGPLGHFGGYTPLGTAGGNLNYTVYASGTDTIKINGEYNSQGSGCKILGKFSVVNKSAVIGTGAHEHGHYLFGSGHIPYAKMCYGYGLDAGLSPWEVIKLAYVGKTNVNYSTNNIYYLNEFSGRDTSNTTILQIPISSNNENEFFLLANRRKESFWDRIMLGDTAHDDPMKIINPEYGKGLYIYHNTDGYNYPYYDLFDKDQECADGLFNWEQNGYLHPDWSTEQWVELYERKSVSYDNDQSNGGLIARDGKSVYNWFSKGKNYVLPCIDGTDRFYSNSTEYWTSREWEGDRYDGWNLGYNEIISPYSSPNTKDWNNNQTGIFIWYKALNNNTATLQIERASENGGNKPLEKILEETPPSRPMGLKVDSCYYSNEHNWYIKLTWLHNMEPDMVRESMLYPPVKRYKIYRSLSNDRNSIPPDKYQYPETVYSLIATVDINAENIPEFIDTASNIGSICSYIPDGCPPKCFTEVYARYRIQAVDKYEDQSTLSDFVQSPAYKAISGGGTPIDPGQTDNLGIIKSIPQNFNLYQNFPNPFNPTTNIQYDIPKSGFVNLTIYDILGREITTLVNEFKNAGSYLISFNASELTSGIYFYKINCGEFSMVKKMIVIK